MKEFCQKLLQEINHYYPIRGLLGNEAYIVGSFRFRGDIYSFMIKTRGCFQRMDKTGTTDWFDLAGTPRKYTAIIYEGVRYELQPTLEFKT
jgi:hypothetical protein